MMLLLSSKYVLYYVRGCCWVVMVVISAQVATILFCSVRHQTKYDIGSDLFSILSVSSGSFMSCMKILKFPMLE